LDLRKVKKLLDLMEEHDLAEVELESEGEKIRLRKDNPTSVPMQMHMTSSPMPTAPPAVERPAVAAAETKPEAKIPKDTVEITSPMVGTFYRAPAPDAEAFIAVGDKVEEESVVCIIEAMKVMNAIKAELRGEIVAILVENGEAVEYGQPLFAVKPAPPQG
jgi:acetyl-CoA carboxylase biotin carboxyl carrier protein